MKQSKMMSQVVQRLLFYFLSPQGPILISLLLFQDSVKNLTLEARIKMEALGDNMFDHLSRPTT